MINILPICSNHLNCFTSKSDFTILVHLLNHLIIHRKTGNRPYFSRSQYALFRWISIYAVVTRKLEYNPCSSGASSCQFHDCSSAKSVLTWWRHQMETFSELLAICAHKGQWRGALLFSLICVWINGWINNHEVGDFYTLPCPLWRHCNEWGPSAIDRWLSSAPPGYNVMRALWRVCKGKYILKRYFWIHLKFW